MKTALRALALCATLATLPERKPKDAYHEEHYKPKQKGGKPNSHSLRGAGKDGGGKKGEAYHGLTMQPKGKQDDAKVVFDEDLQLEKAPEAVKEECVEKGQNGLIDMPGEPVRSVCRRSIS